MKRLDKVLERVGARALAAADMQPEEVLAFVEARPHEMLRKLFLGYVEPPDMDDAVDVTEALSEAVLVTVVAALSAGDYRAAHAAIMFNMGQLLPVGVELARQTHE